MTYSIELFFDAESAGRLRGLWEALQEIYGAPCRSELGVEPHVALAVFRNGEPAGCQQVVEQLASSLGPFRLEMVAVESFPTAEGVVYLRVASTPALLQAHELLHELLGATSTGCHSHYLPGHWVPHCTMATGVAPELLDRVMSACIERRPPAVVQAEQVGGVRYRPARCLHRFPLAKS